MSAETSNPEVAVPVVVRWPRLAVFMPACLAGVAWSLLTLLSLPPASVWWLGLAAPLPIVLVGWTTQRKVISSLGVAFGTLPLWIFHHAWVADVSFAGVFPLVVYLALWPGLVVYVIARLRHVAGPCGPALITPVAWVGLEYVRGELVFGGYAWFLAGQPMVEFHVISRAATLGGVYLVSWLVVALSGVVLASRYGSLWQRRVGYGVSLVLVVLLAASIIVPRGEVSGEPVRIAALQTDVPQSNKVFPTRDQLVEDFRSLIALADEAVADGADLLVTPETVLPGGLLDPDARAVIDEPFGEAMLTEQRRLGVPMLVGCTTLGGLRFETDRAVWDDTFNSVFLLQEGRVAGPRYDKLRPTPFGETLPYVQSLPWLRDLVLRVGLGASGMDFGLTPGGKAVSFEVPIDGRSIVATTPICFESSMAPTVRQLVNTARQAGRPTDVLVVVTNDGWFGSFDAGRAMHLLQARWRCIEHRLPMVRCANTGVSAVIDRDGRVVAALDPRESAVLMHKIEPGPVRTLYQAVGDRVGLVCSVLTVLGLLASVRIRRDPVRSAEEARPSGREA